LCNRDEPLTLRRARADDLEGLYRLACSAGHGLTTLPPDRGRIAQRIAASLEPPPEGGLPPIVLFVLELAGAVRGMAAIMPRIGIDRPFYSYRIDEEAAVCAPYALAVKTHTLTLTTEFTGDCEVGGLVIDPTLRGMGAGRLAARARYLFIAEHRAAFPDRVVAELRGWQDARGVSPVWEVLGRAFYGLPFPDADRLSSLDHDLIAQMGPRHPIYLDVLPREAQAAFGRPHDDSRAALRLLLEEGFRHTGHVDVFDGGPTVQAPIDALKAVRESRCGRVAAIEEPAGDGLDHLVVTGGVADFRAARGRLSRRCDGLALSPPLAKALGVGIGDRVRHVAL
jgi:arginine N-succinyltransferase